MKKIITILLAAVCILALATCGQQGASPGADTAETVSVEGADSYKIGVIVYDITDEEVLAFRQYLEDYIEEVFPGITFFYSDSLSTEEEELDFMQKACDQGVKGFLSFQTLDLEKEVAFCEKNSVYYMLASGTVAEETFQKVADNPWFIGQVGPGSEMEYETGSDMAEFFVKKNEGGRYFILSGGAGLGNEMHLRRTVGILDKLQEAYGVTFDRTSEEIALSTEPVHLIAGDLAVCIAPGYISGDEAFEAASKEYATDRYDVVLSVLPITKMAEVVKDSCLGVVDSYTDQNRELFHSGQLCYVAGKYSSLIGPSFAAMYNAVTGYADDFRDDGKAFRLTQGFWVSEDAADYEEKYSMANSVVEIAYNYEDLGKVCKVFNADATFTDLKDLVSAYTFEDAKARRGK